MRVEDEIIDFLRLFPEISPLFLEEMLETLDDRKLLSDEGKRLRHKIWKTFIKE